MHEIIKFTIVGNKKAYRTSVYSRVFFTFTVTVPRIVIIIIIVIINSRLLRLES